MTEVDQEVSRKRRGGEIVNATCTVSNVAEDEAVSDRSEGLENIRDDERVHQKAFRELESNALSSGGAHSPDALVNLEIVVRRQKGDGGV